MTDDDRARLARIDDFLFQVPVGGSEKDTRAAQIDHALTALHGLGTVVRLVKYLAGFIAAAGVLAATFKFWADK